MPVPAGPTDVVDLTDVRAHLNITTDTHDAELVGFIDAAVEWVTARVGPVIALEVTEIARPGCDGVLWLDYPVLSLTSVVGAYGSSAVHDVATVTAASPELAAGKVWLGPGTATGSLLVTYQAGRDTVPALIRSAVLDYIRWDWMSQRGSSPLPLSAAEEFVAVPGTVPYRIAQKLEPYALGPAVA